MVVIVVVVVVVGGGRSSCIEQYNKFKTETKQKCKKSMLLSHYIDTSFYYSDALL